MELRQPFKTEMEVFNSCSGLLFALADQLVHVGLCCCSCGEDVTSSTGLGGETISSSCCTQQISLVRTFALTVLTVLTRTTCMLFF